MTAVIAAALVAWLAAATVYQLVAQAALWRLLSRRPETAAGPLPSATILRPLDDRAPAREDDLLALCASGAPVLVAVESERSRAGAAALRVRDRAAPGALTVIVGGGPESANRKVAKLISMLPRADGEILVLTDGDVATPPGYLAAVLAPFADPSVGLVTCPYRSVGGPSLAARIDVILTNAGFLPAVALAARLEGVRFALGATIAVRRKVLDGIGGLEPLLGVLADDSALAEKALRAGHRVVLVPLLLDHHVEDEGWPAVWRRHLRWNRTLRVLRPAGYVGTAATHGWAPAILLALSNGGAAAAAAVGTYVFARIGSAFVNARVAGLSARDLALLPLADAVAMLLYAGGLLGRTVHWGTTRLKVNADGSIRPVDRSGSSDASGPANDVAIEGE